MHSISKKAAPTSSTGRRKKRSIAARVDYYCLFHAELMSDDDVERLYSVARIKFTVDCLLYSLLHSRFTLLLVRGKVSSEPKDSQ